LKKQWALPSGNFPSKCRALEEKDMRERVRFAYSLVKRRNFRGKPAGPMVHPTGFQAVPLPTSSSSFWDPTPLGTAEGTR
jgi:hypothetical protein